MANCHQFNIRLVQLIQKHPVLYDHNLEGYTNYQYQEKIWKKFANELKEDVPTLKLKWKNLRSCYTRYLRHAARGSNTYKRSYYLSKHLSFLLPFCKSRSSMGGSYENVGKSCNDGSLSFEGKIEPIDEEEDPSVTSNSYNYNDQDVRMNVQEEQDNPLPNYDDNKLDEFVEDYDNNSSMAPDDKRTKFDLEENDADSSFFNSILPDVRLMDGKQKNQFKIAVLNAIQNALYEDL